MRRTYLLLSALLLTTGCVQLDPAAMYRDAARQLNFTLDRVEPSFELAFPLENSRVGFRLVLGVNNPSSVHFKALALSGTLKMEQGQTIHPLGKVTFPKGLDLPARGRSSVAVDLTFTYQELNTIWGPLQKTLLKREATTWRLDGQATLDAFGIPVTIPLRASRNSH